MKYFIAGALTGHYLATLYLAHQLGKLQRKVKKLTEGDVK